MIEGKANIKFGTGDILITPLVKNDGSKGCVVLQNKGTHKIGEYINDFSGEIDDTVISFENTDSLEVVIERLEKLKAMMNGDVSDCYSPIDYDY